jgi:Protein of unknown function (DUF1592)/Protein of unknown function (DUF1588)/Protein of unknown function (DUF1587)/Protein of unknown function (DUF1585)/Protein of unknown function (DUF1595)
MSPCGRQRVKPAFLLSLFLFQAAVFSTLASQSELERAFAKDIRPFLESYCVTCHDKETRKAQLDLSAFDTLDAVVKDCARWELVLERLRNGEMPPKKAKAQPSAEARKSVVAWIQSFREHEAQRTAGDPGPVLARRLSNAEYDYTIRDLTGVDIRPTRAFPVDPANQAGFDNSGESLAMSPALVNKYLQAAREIADHLALQPQGFTFAPHPVLADTDRDKWAVLRIVDFYRKQPTDYADYFMAAWRYQHRAALGLKANSLAEVARECNVSPKYLAIIWSTLTGPREVGPISKLQTLWLVMPAPNATATFDVRLECETMRDYVIRLRESIVPEVKNLTAPSIQNGSQTMVMWKNRQMAANRRKFDATALKTPTSLTNGVVEAAADPTEDLKRKAQMRRKDGHVQAPTSDIVKRGGVSLAPALVTKESSATTRMAAAGKHGDDPELIVPDAPAERARYEAAFAHFAEIFPDAFYITERARVYLNAEKEQENAGRLLSAGLHSMTGYFRDDQPLYDLILDEAGQKELDRLWDDFNFLSSVPQRMHTSFVWFERTDSSFMRDPEFDPYRPEDKSVTTQQKIHSLSELYLAKAQRNGASEAAQRAIREHFSIVATNIARVEAMRPAAEPTHFAALEKFAERAWRKPLKNEEREELRAFYQACRSDNGLDHEEAMRDCIARVLVSPKFLFRTDLIEGTSGILLSSKRDGEVSRQPLSDYALASRLSYFLWATMPDGELLARAEAGELHRPDILRVEVARMLKDARMRNFATEFAGNWLDFRRFEEHNSVDRTRFPAFNNELRSAMFEEPVRFFLDVAQRDRPVLDLIYAKDTFVNAPLAQHYGISPAPADTNTWVQIENARPFGRGGMLPMAAFLTANSPGLRTSPVKRGNWVVKRILGERIPPPLPAVPVLPSDEKNLGALTLRETLARHRADQACAGCHARFDSFGLVFEGYGPVGERRDVDLGGRRVDTRAEFPGGVEADGLEGLVQFIREHRENDFVDNFCRKLLIYALGRTLILGDEPLIREMHAKLLAENYRFSSLINCIVTSPQFLNARAQNQLAKN